MANEPKRPPTVPAEAIWVAHDHEWELGSYDEQKRPIGEWNWWLAPTGHLCCKTFYHYDENGTEHYTFIRYHPDGTVSRRGASVDGLGEGIHEFFRSKNPTSEVFSVLAKPQVWRTETHLYRNRIVEEHYFDENHQTVQDSFYADTEGRENITRQPNFQETTHTIFSAVRNRAWNEIVQLCRHERKQPYLTNPEHQATLYYYECWALYQIQNPHPRISLYIITPEMVELAQLALHRLPKNSRNFDIPFLGFIIGHFHFQQNDYKTAFIYLKIPFEMIHESEKYPAEIVLSDMLTILDTYQMSSLAYQHLYYAERQWVHPQLNKTLLASEGYQLFVQEAERYKVATPSTNVAPPPSPSDAVQQMAAIQQKRLIAPAELFQETPIDFFYKAALQKTGCVLLIEQDVDWKGNFNLSDINEYLGLDPKEVYIVMIKGNLTIHGDLLLSSPSFLTIGDTALGQYAYQLIVFGDVQAQTIQNDHQMAVHGTITCDLFLAENHKHSVTHAHALDCLYLETGTTHGSEATIHTRFCHPNMLGQAVNIDLLPLDSHLKKTIPQLLSQAYDIQSGSLQYPLIAELADKTFAAWTSFLTSKQYHPHVFTYHTNGRATGYDLSKVRRAIEYGDLKR